MTPAPTDPSLVDLLRSIDQKLGALLTIVLDDYVRNHSVARAHPKSIEVMLRDTGMSTNDISVLLGKTQRAVQLALAEAEAQPRKR